MNSLRSLPELLQVLCDDATSTGEWQPLLDYTDQLKQLVLCRMLACDSRKDGRISDAKRQESKADHALFGARDCAVSLTGEIAT